MADNRYKHKVVLAEFPAHLEKAPSRITKNKIFNDAKILYKEVKELEQKVKILEQEKEMLENINNRLERNLHIFAPGNKTVGDV